MRVLIIGSGGREHALAWKVAQSPRVTEIHVAPGNAGTALEPRTRNVDVAADDVPGLLRHALEAKIDLTIVGPEGPLVLGVTDAFVAAGLRCFGPGRAAAQLEGSAMASDAFFPFADGVEAGIEPGITAVIQPGGSRRDPEVIEACNKAGVAMVFTGRRHFRH